MEVVGSSYVMHDQYREGPYGWDSGRPAMDRQVDELGMYVEGDARKRKWNHEAGKRKAEEVEDEKEPKRTPPKKIFASVGEVGGSGGSSTSSHMSPGWQVNDIDLDLPGELSMNDALLSLPSLAVFKQEAPSPTGLLSPPRRGWTQRRHDERQQQNTGMAVDPAGRDDAHEHIQQQQHAAHTMATLHNGNTESMQCQPTMSSNAIVPTNGFHNNNHDNKSNGLLNICSPNNSLEGFLSPVQNGKGNEQSFKDDTRFQYVLAAATSIATKQHEESLTYLNQGQPYEIKLKKLGDLSHYKGKMLERRLQYMERAAMSAWHVERPGVRVLEVDIPLSYGVTRATQPHEPDRLHTARVGWDPTKDVGVYIKVNCISTEFTAKKHGGEKGVPFRIQVETYLADDLTTRLHAAACQVKVFKLKGADRKHKQDREKLMRRPKSDFDKYQPGCEATVLTTLSNEAIMQSPPLISTSPTYSPEPCVSPKSASNALVIAKPEAALLSPSTQMKPMYLDNEMKVSSPPCGSPGAILPDLPLPTDDPDKYVGLCRDASAVETLQWLTQNRFTQHANTLANFSGADLLRLSRDDIIQICGLADGIRLFNALHAKRIEPRLTVYVCPAGSTVYHAVYLYSCRGQELVHKLNSLIHTDSHNKSCVRASVLVVGPGGARVRLSDELVRHLPDNSTYTLHHADHDSMLLTPTSNH